VITVTNSVVIKRPRQAVFEFVTGWSSAPRWVAGLLETSAITLGPGSTFNDVGKFLGRRMTTSWRVAEFARDEKLVVETTSSPVPAVVSNSFEAVPGGTRLTVVTRLEPTGFFGLASPLLRRQAERQLQVNLENLKDLLESAD